MSIGCWSSTAPRTTSADYEGCSLRTRDKSPAELRPQTAEDPKAPVNTGHNALASRIRPEEPPTNDKSRCDQSYLYKFLKPATAGNPMGPRHDSVHRRYAVSVGITFRVAELLCDLGFELL